MATMPEESLAIIIGRSMEARISKAAELLVETGLSVGEIVYRTGFNQQSYFGKRFKEKMGITPLEYRKKMRT